MFDPDKARLILDAVMLGMHPDTAAMAYGIDAAEHARWIEAGRPGSTSGEPGTELVTRREAQYAQMLDVAVARSELNALRRVLIAEGDADANRWLLERRFPEKWAKTPAAVRTEQMKTGATADQPDPHVVVDEDEVARMRREREEKRRARGGNE